MPLLAEITRAAYRGELERVVAWLQKTSGHVDALDEDGQGLLHAAAIGGRQSVAKELLQRGASVDLQRRGSSPARAALGKPSLRGAVGGTALMMAAGFGQAAE